MSYSGASTARQARETLGKALAALQEDPNIPSEVLAVAQNIAQAVGALFEAERASSEPDGKASVKSALGFVSQTLALLQEVRAEERRGVQLATESIAQTLSLLYPLSTQPSRMPPPSSSVPVAVVPPAAPVPTMVASSDLSLDGATIRDQPSLLGIAQIATPSTSAEAAAAPAPAPGFTPAEPSPQQAASSAGTAPAADVAGTAVQGYRDLRKREKLEVNIGATTESNFYVGFSGDIAEGGVFAATYNILPKGTPVAVLITLPGGFEKEVKGFVRFVRDPMDMSSENEPGMGIQFEALDQDARELILRFIRKRPPMFYDE